MATSTETLKNLSHINNGESVEITTNHKGQTVGIVRRAYSSRVRGWVGERYLRNHGWL